MKCTQFAQIIRGTISNGIIGDKSVDFECRGGKNGSKFEIAIMGGLCRSFARFIRRLVTGLAGTDLVCFVTVELKRGELNFELR